LEVSTRAVMALVNFCHSARRLSLSHWLMTRPPSYSTENSYG